MAAVGQRIVASSPACGGSTGEAGDGGVRIYMATRVLLNHSPPPSLRDTSPASRGGKWWRRNRKVAL